MIVTVNPATGESLAEYPVMHAGELDRLLRQADRDFREWRQTAMDVRRTLMLRLAALLRAKREPLGRGITLEMGKPLGQAVAEVEKCATVCEYYAANAEVFLRQESVQLDGLGAVVSYEPLGVILGVMPWNFPFWQVLRFAAPAIMAGNAVVVKHAPNVTGCSIAIEELFHEAGFPDNLYRAAHVGPEDVDRLTGFMIDHPAVRGVSVTGSTRAGRAVAAKAGMAIKRSVLELGGSDPYIVLDDADLRHAVDVCVAGRLLNSGQSCIAAKRFLVHTAVIADFTAMLVRKMQDAVMGDPFADGVDVGPIARADLREHLHDQVRRSVDAGARLLCGGVSSDGPGFFYPPTVLAGVRKGMAAWEEELFGPVAAVIAVDDDEHAVTVANDSEYGLGSAVFTRTPARALAVARRLDAGNCAINTMVKSDPRLPFGGVKQSGYGRELSLHGIREFVNVRTLYVQG